MARADEPRTEAGRRLPWHDGMTLVTHPDGTRCWHREPQWEGDTRPSGSHTHTIRPTREAILSILDKHFDIGSYGDGIGDPEGAADAILQLVEAAPSPAPEGLVGLVRRYLTLDDALPDKRDGTEWEDRPTEEWDAAVRDLQEARTALDAALADPTALGEGRPRA